jgi:hypothetical protein
MAVGEFEDQKLALEISGNNWGAYRIFVSSADERFSESKRKRVIVNSTTLDKLIHQNELKGILIWIDAQGYEGFILKGAKNVLSSKPPIVIEFEPYVMKRSRSYDALKKAIGIYRGYYDLDSPSNFYPINSLDGLYKRLGEDGAHTDLLVV